MNRERQLLLCKRCKKKEFDSKKGLVCSLTNEHATFERNCDDFEENTTVKQLHNIDNKKQLQSFDKTEKYPALNTIIIVFNLFGWIVGITAVGLFVFSITQGLPMIYNLAFLISGIFVSIVNIGISEAMKLFIDIEENTRRSN